ncbi:MAG: glycosyltransferase family 9 protein [Vulcanimicrobiaceae bacterium]
MSPPQRILLSRTDRIGDLLLSTPAIATVRASFPRAHVTLVTSPYNRVAMEGNDDVDDLVSIPSAIKPRAFGARFENYDVAIALAPRTTDLEIVAGTRAPLRVGYTYVRRWVARAALPLYVNRSMISEADPDLCDRDPSLVVRHEVDQLLDLVALAGATTRVRDLRLVLSEADRRAAASLAPEGAIAFHLGKRWFAEGNTVASTQRLVGELASLGRQVVVTVPAESEAFLGAFVDLGRGIGAVCGLPFGQWASVFERSACVVTVDTGATHVASAVRRPTVVAFEHRYFRLNSQEWSPYGVPSVLVQKPAIENDAALAQFRSEIVGGVNALIHA